MNVPIILPILNPPESALKIQSECPLFLEAFLDPFRQNTVLYHLDLPSHLNYILFLTLMKLTILNVFLHIRP